MPVLPQQPTGPSTITVQALIDYVRTFDWTVPTVGLAGYDDEPALSFANDIIQKIIAKNNPWKWNSYLVPAFFSNPFQQDYPTNISSSNMGWLESATFTDINNPTGSPQFFVKPPLQCVARLLPTYVCGVMNEVSWLLNRNAVTGSWPGPNMLFRNPLVSQGGGPNSNPLTAITDPNGNIQLVTTYGTTGSVQPTWPDALTSPGITTQDGSVVWTVMDPLGVAFRINALGTPGSNIWQFNLTYQQKPPLITQTSQTFSPVPDELQFLIKQGFLTYCYKKSDRKTFQIEYAQWLEDIQEALGQSDRETQSFGVYPAEPIQGGGYGGSGTYVGWPGWSSGGNSW